MSRPATIPEPAGRPVLHLSGARLRTALADAIRAAEPVGGIERFAAALRLRAELIAARVGPERITTLSRGDFEEILPLMATVRRRIGATIEARGWTAVRQAMADLLRDAHVPGTADARVATFENALRARKGLPGTREPAGKGERHLRDLAAELLHAAYPEHYPLMTRWVWDERANTGVLRELWHDPLAGGGTDHIVIDIPDTHETFLVLREEISQFLSAEGLFRDMIWFVDLIQGRVYADYIDSQGGAWLKTDFGSESDPLEQTRRILGLDRIRRKRMSGEVVNGERLGGVLGGHAAPSRDPDS
jgi:hypothetical protein